MGQTLLAIGAPCIIKISVPISSLAVVPSKQDGFSDAVAPLKGSKVSETASACILILKLWRSASYRYCHPIHHSEYHTGAMMPVCLNGSISCEFYFAKKHGTIQWPRASTFARQITRAATLCENPRSRHPVLFVIKSGGPDEVEEFECFGSDSAKQPEIGHDKPE